ncbi:acyl-CoA dehydrogenase family protein [Caenibius tardaugens]|nr:acyl-CoA dehydrogenase family protein [Caenibius tardaugens]
MLDRTIPTPQELIARAEALVPFLREQAASNKAARRITAETIARVKDAGLFRVIQPSRYGGYEMSPEVFGEIITTLGRGDASMGFVFGVVAVHSFHMAFYDDQAAQDVWGEDSSVLVGSPYAPNGKAVKVDGGYRVSGRWSFSSGCDNCDWNFLGGMIEGDEGPILQRLHAFLIPRADAKIVDTWHVTGLQGSGSKDIVVEDAFVPEYRVQRFPIFDASAHPGTKLNNAPLFRAPFMPLFVRSVSSAALGALEGMIEHFSGYTANRLNVLSERVARDPRVQEALGQARAEVEEMKSTMRRDLARMDEIGREGQLISMDEMTLLMLKSANVPHRAEKAALTLMRAAGANGIRNDHPLAGIYNDILVIGQHASNTPATQAISLGKMMLGVQD